MKFSQHGTKITRRRAEHPALPKIRAALAENPERGIRSFARSMGVSCDALYKWEREGAIPKIVRIPPKPPNNTLYWLRDGSNIKAYDPTMVKVKK